VRQKLVPGAELDILTPTEAVELLRAMFEDQVHDRVRAEESKVADANGNVVLDVYTVPLGFEFEVRRFVLTADGITRGTQINFGVGAYGSLSRGDELIGYLGQTGGSSAGVPSEGSYGSEQGPYLRNGETLRLNIAGAAVAALAGLGIQCLAEGVLRKPPSERRRR